MQLIWISYGDDHEQPSPISYQHLKVATMDRCFTFFNINDMREGRLSIKRSNQGRAQWWIG